LADREAGRSQLRTPDLRSIHPVVNAGASERQETHYRNLGNQVNLEASGDLGPDAQVDPFYLPLKDEAIREHTHRSHGLLTGRYSFGTIANIPSSGKTYVGTKFRIFVEHNATTTGLVPERSERV
jgi:hypothetical protein